jgi:hypothetical protein
MWRSLCSMVLTAVLFVSCGGVPEDASGSQI